LTLSFGLHSLPNDAVDMSSGAAFLAGYERSVELLGPEFTTLWASDHFQTGDRPVLECWTRITYLAAHFPQFQVGTLVLGQGYRNPALLAKMAATLQLLTDGRLILGLGAGWHEEEYRAYGYGFPPPASRVEQLSEAIGIMRLMWQGGPVTFHGKHYTVENAYCQPVPTIPIPLLVGSDGRRVVRLAAESADGWNWDASPDLFYEPYGRLKQRLAEIGKSIDEVAITAGVNVNFPADTDSFVGSFPSSYPGYDEVVHGPTPDEAIASLQPFVDAGVSHFMVAAEDLRSLRLFASEVAPALAASAG
jgi:alkanesulfonate monooxygenase SsuD/methylene tetrahydromethanopterin reductase-like flavin-dependent oxidoreductase (luciferase family)